MDGDIYQLENELTIAQQLGLLVWCSSTALGQEKYTCTITLESQLDLDKERDDTLKTYLETKYPNFRIMLSYLPQQTLVKIHMGK